jgi:hypothetical protein
MNIEYSMINIEVKATSTFSIPRVFLLNFLHKPG